MGLKVAAQQRSSSPHTRQNTKSRSSVSSPRLPTFHLQRALGNSATTRLLTTGLIQPKLTVSNPSDKYEREADRVAEQVMRMAQPDPEALLSRSTLNIQRRCADCQENSKRELIPDEEESGLVQASFASIAPGYGSEVESYLNATRGGGHPLSPSDRAYFEPRFGYDFSQVRMHTDAQAAESARALNARAYTTGTHIVFASAQSSREADQGRKLLAHELAHVVQQSGSHAARTVQRAVDEKSFPGGGKVDDVRAGEHLLWNFEIGQHALRPEHTKAIQTIAAEIKGALTRDPSALIDIEGQASFTGTRNDELSAKRAESVKKALVAQGIAQDRLNIISVGSMKSLPGESQENFARSRGVRVITPPHLLLPLGPKPPQPQTGSCQVQASDMVLDGTTVEVTRPTGFLRIHAGSGTAKAPGMTMSAGVSLKPPNCGSLVFVQNVQAFRQIVYKDRTRNTFQTAGFVLDTSDPYKTQVFPGKDPNDPGLVVPTANDSPSQAVDAFSEEVVNTIEARDDFRMFLLFAPQSGARQVLQIGEWSWSGQLKSESPDVPFKGFLRKDASASRIMPTNGKGRATADAPVLSPNVTSLDWVTNNAGATTSPNVKTFAQSHRKVLDKMKPKSEPN
jgi:outer membrane protein OmpA-like peptidoglycan-associated protein